MKISKMFKACESLSLDDQRKMAKVWIEMCINHEELLGELTPEQIAAWKREYPDIFFPGYSISTLKVSR